MPKLPTHVVDRRHWLSGMLTAGLFATSAVGTLAVAPASAWALDDLAAGSDSFRVLAVVKTEGEVRLKSQVADGRTRSGEAAIAKTAPIKATTNLEFEENVRIESDLARSLAYLHILQANSEVQIDRNVTKTTLRDTCTEIVRIGNSRGVTTACLDNPLFAAERGMIEIPVATMFLDLLTTDKKVKVTDKWELDPDVTCRLLGLDAILDGRISVCLVDVNADRAVLEVKGAITGSVRKTATTIEVDGRAHVDRATNRVNWFAANIDETREISELSPGFKVVAQIEIKRAPIDFVRTNETVDTVAQRLPDEATAQLQQFQSNPGFYRFLANRNWITFRDNGEDATYRMVVDNQRVAQCNVTNMIDYEPGRQLSLDGFVSDVRASLGASFSEMLESSEQVTSSGMRALKAISRGVVQEVDIVWIHYHISNDDGRRAAVVFMMNADEYEVFGGEDSQIVSTFELINWPHKLNKAAIEESTAKSESAPAAEEPKKPAASTSAVPNRFKTSR